MKDKTLNRQTEMIGLRVDQGLFLAIRKGAEEEGISTTSFARLLIAQALGYFQEVPLEPPRRQARRKSPSVEMRSAVQVLAVLIDINMNLSCLLRAHGKRSLEQEELDEKSAAPFDLLSRIQTDVSKVRGRLLGEHR
ncbi:hypothetical protein CSC82_04850 [Rhodobacteraceae bacterium 4F10]|nr:hypothetical protein CSC82_04850 [Rhodobacteraceae bacterium 4F10]